MEKGKTEKHERKSVVNLDALVIPTQFESGDTMVITPWHKVMLLKCCDCGLWHRWNIKRVGKDIHFEIIRLDCEPNLEDLELEDIEIETKKIKAV